MHEQNLTPRTAEQTDKRYRRIRWISITVAAILTVTCSALFAVFRPVDVTEAFINGTSVGIVSEEKTAAAAAEQIRTEYESRAEGSLDDIVSVSFASKTVRGAISGLTDDAWRAALCEAYDAALTDCFGVSVDGRCIAYTVSSEAAERVLQRILEERREQFAQIMPEQTDVYVRLLSEYEVAPALARAELPITEEQLYTVLTQGNGADILSAPETQTFELFSEPAGAVPGNVRDPLLTDPELPLPEHKEILRTEFVISRTVIEAIPYPVNVTYDETRMAYYVRTVSRGSDGLIRNTYAISYDADGNEKSRTVIGSRVLLEPVAATEVHGSAVREPGVATGTYIRPVDLDSLQFWVTSTFREYREKLDGVYTGHYGIDIAYDAGTPIYASDGGTVYKMGEHFSYGNFVFIDHGNGNFTRYAHLQSIDPAIEVGALVAQGQLLGEMGSTGNSSAPHLHFEVYRGFALIDPMSVLDMSYGGR